MEREKSHFSANIIAKCGLSRFSVTAFSSSKKRKRPVECDSFSESPFVNMLGFKLPTQVLPAKPLFRCVLLYEVSTCGTSLLSFSKGIGFGVYLIPAAFPSGRKVGFYMSCGDFDLLQIC